MNGYPLLVAVTLLLFSAARVVCVGGESLGDIKQLGTSPHQDETSEVAMIVATADGNVHGMDIKNNLLWSTPTGSNIISVSHDPDDTNIGGKDEGGTTTEIDHLVVPSIDGGLFFKEGGGMRKTSTLARVLNEEAPFVSKEGLLFTARRNTRLFGLDLNNGELFCDLPTDVEKFDHKVQSGT